MNAIKCHSQWKSGSLMRDSPALYLDAIILEKEGNLNNHDNKRDFSFSLLSNNALFYCFSFEDRNNKLSIEYIVRYCIVHIH